MNWTEFEVFCSSPQILLTDSKQCITVHIQWIVITDVDWQLSFFMTLSRTTWPPFGLITQSIIIVSTNKCPIGDPNLTSFHKQGSKPYCCHVIRPWYRPLEPASLRSPMNLSHNFCAASILDPCRINDDEWVNSYVLRQATVARP